MKRADREPLIYIWLFIAAAFSLLVFQFFRLQVIESEKWFTKAARQHYLLLSEPSPRGSFFSNHELVIGHPSTPVPFVIDVPKLHLYIDPKVIPDQFHEEMVEALCFLTESHDRRSFIARQFQIPSRSRRIVTYVDPAVEQRVLDWWKPFYQKHKIAKNAIYFLKDYQRCYPFKGMLGQVLHTVRDDKDPETEKPFPTGGLEASMNDYLLGEPKKKLYIRAPRHPIELKEVLSEGSSGGDVYLTINHHIQAICEEELKRGVLRSRAKRGWAVMMDPYTGEIMAFAQYPFFEPGNYRRYFNAPHLVERSRIKAIQDVHEPGSIMKPITVAIALLANSELKRQGRPPIFDPKGKMDSSNPYFPGRKKPLRDLRLHRYMNMYMALQKSSNIYMARLVEKIIDTLGRDWYRNALIHRFGFGQKSGIELPAENEGMVPKPGVIYPNGALQWSQPTPYSLAIGYNLLANALQMLRAHSVLVNGGYLVKPTLIRKIIRQGKSLEIDRGRSQKVLPKSISDELSYAMQFATKPGGSAPLADIPGFTEGGKTGSAEKVKGAIYSKKMHHSSFIGFAPATSPRLIMIVVMDEVEAKYIPGLGKMHMGGKTAAPVFREAAKRVLHYLGEVPDDPYGYPRDDHRFDPQKASFFKETRELTNLYNEWNQ